MNEPAPRTLGLIGVPSSAGAHSPGQEKAPAALRDAGLVERIAAAGLGVVDHGDLPRVRWRPDRAHPRRQNLGAVVDVARGVADRVAAALAGGETPLVVGGDCTVELGVLAGALRHGEEVGLLYFDAHPDLNTPDSVVYGALDWMGMAHALGESGATEELSRVGPRFPLLSDDRVFFFGYVPHELTDHEREVFARRSLRGVPVDRVAGRAKDAAMEALAEIGGWPGRFLVHFDVDVIDFVDFPIADFPQLNAGLTFAEAMDCLAVFAASPRFAGLTVTEFNPDHADEEGELARVFVDGLARALAGPARSG